MKLEELKLRNDEELAEFAKQSPVNAMLVARHYNQLYQTKIDALRKIGREDLIPEYERKLRKLNSGKNKNRKRKPKPRPSLSEKTERNGQEAGAKVELQEAKMGDMAQGQ